jgi:hypothetical protein
LRLSRRARKTLYGTDTALIERAPVPYLR